MNCSDIRSELTLYADGVLDGADSQKVADHLDECPLCRTSLAEIHDLRTALRRMRQPAIPAVFQNQVKRALREEIRTQNTKWLPVSAEARVWLRLRVMPYAVGALASVAIGFSVVTLMFSGLRDRNVVATRSTSSDTVLLASNRDPFIDPDLISPTDYARARLDVSGESPSLNPQGALVALTKSFVRGRMKDDEVVVVADVFSNGLAQVAEVVERPRDEQAMAELEKALASNDPRYAPFLTANLDNRSDSMRVVLRFQSVNVPTRLPRK